MGALWPRRPGWISTRGPWLIALLVALGVALLALTPPIRDDDLGPRLRWLMFALQPFCAAFLLSTGLVPADRARIYIAQGTIVGAVCFWLADLALVGLAYLLGWPLLSILGFLLTAMLAIGFVVVVGTEGLALTIGAIAAVLRRRRS